ncbi:MAG: PEP-CTERM sorting domain-containing protein [Pirellulales bacterium]
MNNTITAAVFRVGDGSGPPTGNNQVTFGSGTNVINADTVNVGSASTSSIRSGGKLVFDGSDTTGTLKIRNSTGGETTRAAINLINTTGNTGSSMESVVDFTGHVVDIRASTLTMAARGVGAGNATATWTSNEGLLDVTTWNMAIRSGTGTGTSTATVNLGDGVGHGTPTTNIGTLTMASITGSGAGSIADFNVTGGNVNIGTGTGTAINMANAASGRTATSTIDLSGGNVSVTGNIARTAGGGTESATITLFGANLNMNGKTIGTAANTITFVAESGVLQNLAELNGGGALQKTTSGTLTMLGSNTYTGATNVTAGVVTVNGSTGTGLTTVSGGAVLNGGVGASAGTVGGGLAVNGTFSAGSGSGAAGNGVGALNVAGAAAWNANANMVFDFAAVSGNQTGTEVNVGTNWDYLTIGGGLNLALTPGQQINLYINSWDGVLGYGVNNNPGDVNEFNKDAAVTGDSHGGQLYTYTWKWLTANMLQINGGAALTGDQDLSQYFNVHVSTVDTTFGNGVFTAGSYGSPNLTGGHFWVSSVDNNLFINYSAVPEPGSMLMIGVAGLAFAGYRRRLRRAAAQAADEQPQDAANS